MMKREILPTTDMHYPTAARGESIGLGKPIRKNGKRIGSRHQVCDAHGRIHYIEKRKQD